MKKMKKIVGLLLTMVMVLAMAVPAMAAGNFKITLNTNMSGHTYSAYQIFTGDLVEKDGNKVLTAVEWGTGVTDTDAILAELEDLGLDVTAESTASDVAKALVGKGDDSTLMQAVADVFGDHLSTTAISSTETKEDGATTGYVISGLEAGYYLVKDTGTVPETEAATRYILEVVGDVTTDVKAEVPTIEKKIVINATTKVDANNAGVGQVVSYEITGNVPDYTGYDTYYYVINDTLSAGLTFNNDVKVEVNGSVLTKGTDYYVYSGEEAGNYTFRVAFEDIKEFAIGADVVVTYSATVNDNAVIGEEGNPNTVNLTYSNDPNDDEGGERVPGLPDDPKGETPVDKTITYVAEIDITKTDDKGKPLAGAEFTLTGFSKQTVLKDRTYYEFAENGTYYLLKDGTYTTVSPDEDSADLYVSTTVKFVKKTATEITEVTSPVKMVVTSDANGKVLFKGLGEGTYTIEETVVPEGYNKAQDVKVVIVCDEPETVSDGTEKAYWEIGTQTSEGVTLLNAEGGRATTGIYQTTIVNKPGVVLPSTGGIGTTIFYVVGAILVIGAAVVLITRKRMSN